MEYSLDHRFLNVGSCRLRSLPPSADGGAKLALVDAPIRADLALNSNKVVRSAPQSRFVTEVRLVVENELRSK